MTKPEHKEIIEEITNLFEKRIKENVEAHRKDFESEIEMLKHLKTYHLLLSMSMNEKNEGEDFKGRVFIGKNYLGVIANNFHIARNLFEQGFHVQLQLLFRSQFEFTNALIAYIGDDEYFNRFGREHNDRDEFLTPKRINTEKSIKKIMKEYNPEKFKEVWSVYKEIADSIYSELSITTHGNIPTVALQSFGGNKDDEELLENNLCGVKYPLKVTKGIVRQMLHYFQITRGLLFVSLEKKNLIDKEMITNEFIEYYSKKFQIMKEK